MGIPDGGFWVEVKFKDYSSRSTYMHIYFEFWQWGAFNMVNIYMYWERNPLIQTINRIAVHRLYLTWCGKLSETTLFSNHWATGQFRSAFPVSEVQLSV